MKVNWLSKLLHLENSSLLLGRHPLLRVIFTQNKKKSITSGSELCFEIPVIFKKLFRFTVFFGFCTKEKKQKIIIVYDSVSCSVKLLSLTTLFLSPLVYNKHFILFETQTRATIYYE